MFPFRRAILAFAPILLLGAGQAGATTPQEKATLTRMVDLAKASKWVPARDAARRSRDPAALEAYEWLRLRQPGIDNFERMARWIEAHPDWPSQAKIQVQGEYALDGGAVLNARVIAFFDRFAPRTGVGAVRYAMALKSTGRVQDGSDVAADTWLTKNLSATEERRLLAAFPKTLRSLHDRRLDTLIWKSYLTAAERHLTRASRDQRTLGAARIALMRGKGNVDGMVARVPAALKNDPGLSYARMVWRKKKGLTSSAEAMMVKASATGALGQPERWADERAVFMRGALKERDFRRAYVLAAGNGLAKGIDFAELEWMAGWIALRKLNDPAAALGHFERLHRGVVTPVSRARAAYWAGEANAKMGRTAESIRWHGVSAKNASAFYGQLSAKRLHDNLSHSVPKLIAATRGPCVDDPSVAVGSALAAGGATVEARLFFYHALEKCRTPGESKALGLHAEGLGAFRISVGMGTKLRRKSIFIPEISHPILSLPREGCKGEAAPERALALAVARQESGFDPKARSRAGARGVMQVMPGTAKVTARAAGVRYDLGRLSSERMYNARIGQCYLSQLLERFDGSYPLAVAGYNAGPGRVSRWLEEFGDPRKGEIDLIDWIERIPFRETRNYVQRVLEGLNVYRARLGQG
jgi:soluble lytic murein transglycosylase